MLTVYTCVTDGYDRLLAQPIVPGVRYLCFTDRPAERSPPGWEMRPLMSPPEVNTAGLANRYHKMLCYDFADADPYSVYIDGNIRLRTDPVKLVAKVAATGAAIAAFTHPARKSIAEEFAACAERGKISGDEVETARAMLARQRADGFLDDQGLTANNLIIRDRRSAPLRKAMEHWWRVISIESRRDQLSLQYVLWHEGLTPLAIEDIMPSKAVQERRRHKISGLRRWPAFDRLFGGS